MAKKFEIFESSIEIKYRNRKEIKTGCSLGNDPDPVKKNSFDTREEALEALKEFHTEVKYMSGYAMPYYIVTEFYVEENDYDEEGEWISGGDVWAITEMINYEE